MKTDKKNETGKNENLVSAEAEIRAKERWKAERGQVKKL